MNLPDDEPLSIEVWSQEHGLPGSSIEIQDYKKNLGQKAVVTETIELGRVGRVKFEATTWLAVCPYHVVLPVGTPVQVTDSHSTKLIVEPIPSEVKVDTDQAKSRSRPETEEYLEQRGVPKGAFKVSYDLTSHEGREAEKLKHLTESRNKVLQALVLPMYVIPIWLMVMLTFPAFGNKAFSERIQFALLAALASDVVGLCFVVTRNLFPEDNKGSSRRTHQKPDELNDEKASLKK